MRGRALATGALAGLVGLGCCVGPTIAALIGVMSASAAVELSLDLYGHWGWAFKLAGAGVAVLGVAVARKRFSCGVRPLGRGRFTAIVAVTGAATYAAAYAATTWLGSLGGYSR